MTGGDELVNKRRKASDDTVWASWSNTGVDGCTQPGAHSALSSRAATNLTSG